MESSDDDALVAGLRAGDAEVFEYLLDQWSAGLLRVATAYVSTQESAREVVQDTWLAVIRGIDGFEGRSSLRTWVFRILVNIAKRRGAQEARTVPLSALAPDAGPTVDPALFRPPGAPFAGHWWSPPAPWPTPEQAVLDDEFHRVLARALDHLPAAQHAVVTLRDVLGYDSAEVCAMLAITPGNQRVLLHRGRAFLRRAIAEYLDTRRAVDGSPDRKASR